MTTAKVKLSVFTKPWKTASIDELGEKVSGWGFDGIEFPIRDGFQVEPHEADKKLPLLVKQLGEYGLSVFSIASSTEERIFAACAESGVPMIRVMPRVSMEEGYLASVKRERAFLESLLPLCERYGVKIGVQQHCGDFIIDATGISQLLDGLDAGHIQAIWDAAHDGLTGRHPEHGLEIVWSQLGMVNFKNAFYRRTNGPEASVAEWETYFTTGTQGLASWSRIAAYLKKRGYDGVITLSAEYDDEERVDEYTATDVAYMKSLFA